MVGARGFEPPTPASRRQCSTRLSYAPSVGGGLALLSVRIKHKPAILDEKMSVWKSFRLLLPSREEKRIETQKAPKQRTVSGPLNDGRSERIRTSDPCLPKTVLYQAELRSVILRSRVIMVYRRRRKIFLCQLPRPRHAQREYQLVRFLVRA